MNIGIVGAGAIGSYYAGLLSRAGQEVRLVARGDHLAAIQSRGLEVRTPAETFVAHPEATSDDSRLVGCDYVLVSVKGYSLPEVAPALASAAASGAAIVPLLNGIDVAERLVSLGVPRESVVGGFVRASIVRTAPGVVERVSGFDLIVIGELDRTRRERTTKLAQTLAASGATTRESDDILHELWHKFAFIVTMGVVCGLSRQAMGAVIATDSGRQLLESSLAELVRVSQGALSPNDERTILGELCALQPHIKPSFLLDLERGGPTEVDMLAGAVSRLGRARGVATPIHDVATAAFHIATHTAS